MILKCPNCQLGELRELKLAPTIDSENPHTNQQPKFKPGWYCFDVDNTHQNCQFRFSTKQVLSLLLKTLPELEPDKQFKPKKSELL